MTFPSTFRKNSGLLLWMRKNCPAGSCTSIGCGELILYLDRRPCLRTLFGRSPLHFVRDRDERSTNASSDSIRVGVFHKTIPDRLPTKAHSFDTFGLPT